MKQKIAVFIILAIILTTVGCTDNKKTESEDYSSQVIDSSSEASSEAIMSEETVSEAVSQETSSEVTVSEETVSVESTPQEQPVESAPTVVPEPEPLPQPEPPVVSGTGYKYNTNTDIDDNVFLDSLIYTGYNIEKHRADGLMWHYILASQKRGKGWLSNIGYAGGSSGYETTADGKPDISAFERKGLVCASYVTYVYFNYLPNVAGIDTSSLTKPEKSYSAHDWYIAAKDWITKGYSKSVGFTASLTSSGFINFSMEEDMPIGSIMVFSDARKKNDHGSHVAIYAGYKNGYHWVYHVGNENGPEFCAVERMHFGPDPQWPLMMITAPSNIRMTPLLEVDVKDDSGTAVSGVGISVYSAKTTAITELGNTDANGILSKEGLSYGDYTVIYTIPEGYTAETNSIITQLSTANNSCNKVSIVLNKVVPPVSQEVADSASETVPQQAVS